MDLTFCCCYWCLETERNLFAHILAVYKKINQFTWNNLALIDLKNWQWIPNSAAFRCISADDSWRWLLSWVTCMTGWVISSTSTVWISAGIFSAWSLVPKQTDPFGSLGSILMIVNCPSSPWIAADAITC